MLVNCCERRITMTVQELKELAYCDTLIVKSGYNGKVLTNNYNSKRHKETIGNREVISIWSDIKTCKATTQSSAFSVLCCHVSGNIEYEEEHKNNG